MATNWLPILYVLLGGIWLMAGCAIALGDEKPPSVQILSLGDDAARMDSVRVHARFEDERAVRRVNISFSQADRMSDQIDGLLHQFVVEAHRDSRVLEIDTVLALAGRSDPTSAPERYVLRVDGIDGGGNSAGVSMSYTR